MRQISIHNRTILYFIIGIFLSGTAKSQQDNSFNFQTDGANSDFVTVSSNVLIQPTTGMTLEAWVKPTEDPATYEYLIRSKQSPVVSSKYLPQSTLDLGSDFGARLTKFWVNRINNYYNGLEIGSVINTILYNLNIFTREKSI